MLFDKRDDIKINISTCEELTATVYRYIEPITNKNFILKVQEEPFDNPKEDEEILLEEFRKLVYLSNEPEIATVNYLVETDDNRIGYLMEYVQGTTLSDYINKNTITLDDAVDIIYHISLAIEKAHSMNIFHNDLEHMNNILINDLGFIKIIDFLDLTIFHQKETSSNDIKSIQKIANILCDNLTQEEKKIFKEIISYLQSIEKIKNVPRNILLIYKMVFDILHFNPYVVRFFLLLLPLINEADKNFYSVIRNFKIDKNELGLKNIDLYSDLFLSKSILNEKIKKKYTLMIRFVQSLGYVGEFSISTKKIDEKYYHYEIILFFTPKIIKFNKIINKYQLLIKYKSLQDFDRTINEYVFTDRKEILSEKLIKDFTVEDINRISENIQKA